jgi:UDP-glucose-4-epimerase GalE
VPSERLREVDLNDAVALAGVFAERPYDAVIHFAGYISVGESARVPEVYFTSNVSESLSLFTAMIRHGIQRLVFSSTAAVYGTPASIPIREDSPYAPVSPYGESKVMVERMLSWFHRIHDLRAVNLRYFNAAGADPDGKLGEEHEPETHLIPLLFRAVRSGEPVTVFGEDYATPDGTCIRDYIHVADLAEAHLLALESLLSGGQADTFNVGTGAGHSVREVIRAVADVTGAEVPVISGPRREGDPPVLVADPGKLQRTLGWRPRHSSLSEIVSSAWRFETSRPAR